MEMQKLGLVSTAGVLCLHVYVSHQEFINSDITALEEVEYTITALQNSKSSGSDNNLRNT